MQSSACLKQRSAAVGTRMRGGGATLGHHDTADPQTCEERKVQTQILPIIIRRPQTSGSLNTRVQDESGPERADVSFQAP